MPVVGEGSFGCVHKPSLECKEPNIDYTNMVSKIMTRDSAKDELKEFKLLDKIDKEHKHFLGTPIKCNVKNSVENRTKLQNAGIPTNMTQPHIPIELNYLLWKMVE